MNERIERALADLKAQQQAGEWMPCPRCGRDTMKEPIYTNALSREADGIYVCDACGTAEALKAFMKNPLPVSWWAMFRLEKGASHLKELPGTEAMDIVREQDMPILTEIFEQWSEEKPGANFEPYRLDAMSRCPGITQLWPDSFQALYETADGHLLIQFRRNPDGTTTSRGFIVMR